MLTNTKINDIIYIKLREEKIMKINYVESAPVKFDKIPTYKPFLFNSKVYIRISDNSAVYIGGSLVNTFSIETLVYPCVIEEISIRKV